MRIGILEWWNPKKKFGLCVVKNADFSIQRYFIHMSNVVKCIPDLPGVDNVVRFVPSTEKPKIGQHYAALNVEIFETQEQLDSAVVTAEVARAIESDKAGV